MKPTSQQDKVCDSEGLTDELSFVVEKFSYFLDTWLDPQMRPHALTMFLHQLVGSNLAKTNEPHIRIALQVSGSFTNDWRRAWPWNRGKLIGEAKRQLLTELLKLKKGDKN